MAAQYPVKFVPFEFLEPEPRKKRRLTGSNATRGLFEPWSIKAVSGEGRKTCGERRGDGQSVRFFTLLSC